MSELKSCPFCGNENIKIEERPANSMPDDKPATYFVVACFLIGGCGCYRDGWSKEQAIGRWNTRHQQEEVEAMAKVLESCRDELYSMIEKHNKTDGNYPDYLADFQTVFEADTSIAAYQKLIS